MRVWGGGTPGPKTDATPDPVDYIGSWMYRQDGDLPVAL